MVEANSSAISRRDLNQRNSSYTSHTQSPIQDNLNFNLNERKNISNSEEAARDRWSGKKMNSSPSSPTAQYFHDSFVNSPIGDPTTSPSKSTRSFRVNDTPIGLDDKVVKAAIAIQKSWRMYRSNFLSKKRILSFSIFGLRYYSALTIQRWWRGYHTRKVLSQEANSLVIIFPVCLCEKALTELGHRNNRRPSVFDEDPLVRRKALSRVLWLEIFAFERWLRSRKTIAGQSSTMNSFMRDDGWPSHGGGLSVSEVIPRSIVPLLISYAPFQFYDGIIYNDIQVCTWSQTYVRPNLPDECAIITNKEQSSKGLGNDASRSGSALGYCMRRPTCFKCGRRITELAYSLGDQSTGVSEGGRKKSTMPVWVCPQLKVSGTFDALPWAKHYQLSYCSLRRCLYYTIPKSALIMAHSASRHLVAVASAKALCSGYNEDLTILYDCGIQALLDAMLPELRQGLAIKDNTAKLRGECLAMTFGTDELRRQLETFINHRFGTRTLISVDFKFIRSKANVDNRIEHKSDSDWLINEHEYEHAMDPHSNVNNFVKLVV